MRFDLIRALRHRLRLRENMEIDYVLKVSSIHSVNSVSSVARIICE